jgi:hypothetical protein
MHKNHVDILSGDLNSLPILVYFLVVYPLLENIKQKCKYLSNINVFHYFIYFS